MGKKTTDFRYNTGATKVPWAAVGENYNAADTMEVIKFLMQGEGAEYDEAIKRVEEAVYALSEQATPPGKLSLAGKVEAAEAAVDEYLGIENSLFLTNCTAGFEIACKYAGIGPGDEVIVPAISFIATMAPVLAMGAKVVFCDLDPKTINLDPADLENKITERTKMIIPVHIGGYPCDMDAINAIAKKHGIIVLEDAAHAFGAEYKGKKIGTISDFTSFSFHEVKNLTSFGEGGILTTTRADIKDDIKRARFLGMDHSRQIKNWLYDITAIPGYNKPFVAGNHSTTEIQGLGLLLQLSRYQKILDERRESATYLTNRLAGNPAIIPQDLGNADIVPTFHLYQIQIDPEKAGGDVQTFKKKLEEKSVTNIPHFGPLYRCYILEQLGYDRDALAETCPKCEEVFDRRFTHLPIYGLTKDQLDYMADAILESVAEMQAGK